MRIEIHEFDGVKIAGVISDDIIIKTSEDGLDLMGNLYYQDFNRIIIHEKNITPEFFVLKNGIAGEILQKFSTYRIRLAIVGNFSKYSGKSIKDFIFESNKFGHINFLSSTEEALKVLSRN